MDQVIEVVISQTGQISVGVQGSKPAPVGSLKEACAAVEELASAAQGQHNPSEAQGGPMLSPSPGEGSPEEEAQETSGEESQEQAAGEGDNEDQGEESAMMQAFKGRQGGARR